MARPGVAPAEVVIPITDDVAPAGAGWIPLAPGWWQRRLAGTGRREIVAAEAGGILHRIELPAGVPPAPLAPGLSWTSLDVALGLRQWLGSALPVRIEDAAVLRVVTGRAPACRVLLPTAEAQARRDIIVGGPAGEHADAIVQPAGDPGMSWLIVGQLEPPRRAVEALVSWAVRGLLDAGIPDRAVARLIAWCQLADEMTPAQALATDPHYGANIVVLGLPGEAILSRLLAD